MTSKLLYHEKQVAALCGVHCLNTLLQGAYFSEVDLAQIGQDLDALERQYMQESGVESAEYLKYLSEESGNVALDGMFSIQVLSKALQAFGLQVVSYDSPEAWQLKADPTTATAFICNLQEHWFTLRTIAGEWWNFNSLFPAPQPLSNFYLAAFLDSLKEQGYTIFAVVGELPHPRHVEGDTGAGRLFTPEQARIANEEASTVRQRGRIANVLETALSKAAAQGGALQLKSRKRGQDSLLGSTNGHGTNGDIDADADLAAAIRASLGQPGASADPGFADDDMDQDPELAAAIAASLAGFREDPAQVPDVSVPELEPEPSPGPGVVELAFRLPQGQRATRRFAFNSTCAALYSYLQSVHSLSPNQHHLATQFPRKVLGNDQVTVAEAGLADRSMLNVEVIRP